MVVKMVVMMVVTLVTMVVMMVLGTCQGCIEHNAAKTFATCVENIFNIGLPQVLSLDLLLLLLSNIQYILSRCEHLLSPNHFFGPVVYFVSNHIRRVSKYLKMVTSNLNECKHHW